MKKLALVGVGLIALVAWTFTGREEASPQAQLDAAEAELRSTFAGWRARVEKAAARLAELGRDEEATPGALFSAAERLVAEEGVDGVAIVDSGNRARFWAGRTFDADPELDFFGVRPGLEVVRILDLPAHRVLFAARAAGDETAVAFLAFDERFPLRRSLAEAIAARAGLARVVLRFSSRNVPMPAGEQPLRRTVVIDGLVHATLVAKGEAERKAEIARRTDFRLLATLWMAAGLAAAGLWHLLGRRLPHGALLRTLLAVALIAGLRGVLALTTGHSLWDAPADTLLTSVAALLGTLLLLGAAQIERARPATAILAFLSLAACVVLPRLYYGAVNNLVDRTDGINLFDPLRVFPDLDAAILVGSLGLLTVACFLFVHAARLWGGRLHRLLGAAPFLAVAAGLAPWPGPYLALGCVLAVINLTRAATRAEKAAGMTIVAALTSFPLLSGANRAVFVREVEISTRDLVRRAQRTNAARELRRAVRVITDPAQGVAGEVAQSLVERRGLKHLAFRLWTAANWDSAQPCAVQVWDAQGRLVSAFDFDSPPLLWLPGRGDAPREGDLLLYGQEEGEALHFYAREFPLKTIGDERLAGTARISVPDRWDVLLLSQQRPALFSRPLDLGVSSHAPPVLLAELAPDGHPIATSAGTTAEMPRASAALRRRARERGCASERITYRGRPARLVLGAARYSFGAVVFEESILQQDSFVFAKVLLTYCGACLLYLLALLVARRGRVTLLFRHRVAFVLVLLAVPPVLILAWNNNRVAQRRYREELDERLQRRLDLAETLLRERQKPVDNAWCQTLAANHLVDINVYRGQEMVATSRPWLRDTGLIGRRLDARAYKALVLEGGDDYAGREHFCRSATLRAAYRKVPVGWDPRPVILGAPTLEDPQTLERKATENNALLLAIYVMTATVTVFIALALARSLTRPVRELKEATGRVASGELDAKLPEKRRDEFGELIRDFNRMTKELRGAQELRGRAERAAAWQEMARQVAHEIKNPLTPIKLTIQNLLAAYAEDKELFREQFEDGARLIMDQIDALHRIAGAFSAYAAFPAGAPRAIDLNLLMEDVAALYGAGEEGEVVVEPAGAPAVVRADYDQLRRALINLVTNSRQAGAKKVILRATTAAGGARLDIIDDGHGIPRDVQDHIFEPSFTTKTSGTGLGLPIVRRILDDCGATIKIQSLPPHGTTITVWFGTVSG